jgi:cytochrome c oxidase cbb3-type subunit III
MKRLAAPSILLSALVLLLAGCGHAPGHPPAAMLNPDQVMDFHALYGQNCAACHGANGQNGPAIDLANPEYQALVDDATLRKWIAGGMAGTEMPAFAQSAGGMLTDAQIGALIAGMRREWSAANTFAGATPPPYADTNPGDAQRGAQAYDQRCAGCHEKSPQQITSPDYLALVSNQALRSILIAGRPDIGQPDWRYSGQGTPLSNQGVTDLVAYLASLRNPQPAPSNSTAQAGR